MPAYNPPNTFYSQVTLPAHICPEQFMGKEGYHLKRITDVARVDYLWYDFTRGVIEVWGPHLRLARAIDILQRRMANF
jgi:hypothetical protein